MPTNRQRREAERRRLQRRVERRAKREARRRRYALVASIAGVVVVAAIVLAFVVATGNEKSTDAGGGPTGHRSSGASTSAGAAGACTWTKHGAPARPVHVPSTTRPPRTGTVDVAVQTSQGAMTFRLNRAAAPCTVASFLSLTEQHYYDGTPCHRLTTGTLSVLQCGDPTGSGSGGPGYSFADELSGIERYSRGVIAMANAGPNTNGSQFFIVYKNSQLGPKYTVFGTVRRGLAVVDKVAAHGSTPATDGKPKLPITLTKLTVAR